MFRYSVTVNQVGENGINYGNALQFVTAPDETSAAAEAIRVQKGQGGPVAHICTLIGVKCHGAAKLCGCCGKYHDFN